MPFHRLLTIGAPVALCLVAGFTPRTTRPQPVPAEVTAFTNVGVIPMDSNRVLPGQTVLVQNGRISALGPADHIAVPAGATRIDGRGRFLIPGLADMHAHLRGFRDLEAIGGPDPLSWKENLLFLWLAHGLTTVRILDHGNGDTSAAYGPATSGKDVLALKRRAAIGELLSPRIYTSGDLTGEIVPSDKFAPLRLDQVTEALRTYRAAGYDFITVHPRYIRPAGASAEVFDSLAAAAHRAGVPLVGHTVVPLDRALATYRSIEQLSGYLPLSASFETAVDEHAADSTLETKLDQLAGATRRAGVWNCPTLYDAARNHAPPERLALARRLVKALQDSGAGLVAGSDRLQTPREDRALDSLKLTRQRRRLEQVYGYAGATHQELQALVDAGLTPYEALVTATRNVATYFGTSDSTGSVAVGKRADLVLLEGNPLIDIRQTQRIAGVMADGRWLDRAALDWRIASIEDWLNRRCTAAAVAAGRTPCPNGLQDP